MASPQQRSPQPGGSVRELDAVIVGAGFSSLYMLYRTRDLMGLDVHRDRCAARG